MSCSPPKHVKINNNSFSYLDFCSTFIERFTDEEDSKTLLTKILDMLVCTESEPTEIKEQAQTLLNNIEDITDDKRVKRLYQIENFKQASTSKVIEESTYTQNLTTQLYKTANHKFTVDDLLVEDEDFSSEFESIEHDSNVNNANDSFTIESNEDESIEEDEDENIEQNNSYHTGEIPPSETSADSQELPQIVDYLFSINARDFVNMASIEKSGYEETFDHMTTLYAQYETA